MKVRNRLSHLPRMLSPIEQFRDDIARVQALSGLHQAFGELITASELNLTGQDVKNRLRAIVNRRNQIVHEADLDPSYPRTGNRWPNFSCGCDKFLRFHSERLRSNSYCCQLR